MSKEAQAEAKEVLEKLGVYVILNTSVKDYTNNKVILSDGKELKTNSFIWASGVVAKVVSGLSKDVIGRGRRLLVDAYNRVQGANNIFAIGDLCLQTTDKMFPNGHPQVAQVVIDGGQKLPKNLLRLQDGEEMKRFLYNDKGSMEIISNTKPWQTCQGFHSPVSLPGSFASSITSYL